MEALLSLSAEPLVEPTKLALPSFPSCQAEAASALYLTPLWQIATINSLLYHTKASPAERFFKTGKHPVYQSRVSLNHSPPAAKVIPAVASTGNVWKRVSFLCG